VTDWLTKLDFHSCLYQKDYLCDECTNSEWGLVEKSMPTNNLVKSAGVILSHYGNFCLIICMDVTKYNLIIKSVVTALSSCAHVIEFLLYNNNTKLPAISPSHSVHFKLVPLHNTLIEKPVVSSIRSLANLL